MTDEMPPPLPPDDELMPGAVPAKRVKDPAGTLNVAMLVYIFVTLVFALPLVIAPVAFFDAIGIAERTADDLGGLRWVGAVLLAWATSGILVLARPGGRAIFVTTGALQFSFGALAFLYSWSIDEYTWDLWYHALATALLMAGSVVLWWARFSARKVLGDRHRTDPDA